MNSFKNFEIKNFPSSTLPWYCDMSSEIIQGVAYDNYDDFQNVNFIFSQKNSFHYFGDHYNDETDLRVKVVP